jgi:hypothetical protein
MDAGRRESAGVTSDLALVTDLIGTSIDPAHICGRATHVERHDSGMPVAISKCGGSDHAAGWPGQQDACRKSGGGIG